MRTALPLGHRETSKGPRAFTPDPLHRFNQSGTTYSLDKPARIIHEPTAKEVSEFVQVSSRRDLPNTTIEIMVFRDILTDVRCRVEEPRPVALVSGIVTDNVRGDEVQLRHSHSPYPTPRRVSTKRGVARGCQGGKVV